MKNEAREDFTYFTYFPTSNSMVILICGCWTIFPEQIKLDPGII